MSICKHVTAQCHFRLIYAAVQPSTALPAWATPARVGSVLAEPSVSHSKVRIGKGRDPFKVFGTDSLPTDELLASNGALARILTPFSNPQSRRGRAQHSLHISGQVTSPGQDAAAEVLGSPAAPTWSPIRAQPAGRNQSPAGSRTMTPSAQVDLEHSMLSGPRLLTRTQSSPSQSCRTPSALQPVHQLAYRSSSPNRTESRLSSPIRFVPLTTPLHGASKPGMSTTGASLVQPSDGTFASHLELRRHSPFSPFGRDASIVKDVRHIPASFAACHTLFAYPNYLTVTILPKSRAIPRFVKVCEK